jgi:ASC-1-like (ASCH) protein
MGRLSNMTHELKIYKEYFKPVLNGSKTFEIRKNDRHYRVGDRIILSELQDDKKNYTGRYFKGVITYITDYAQKDGYVVFSFRKVDWRY